MEQITEQAAHKFDCTVCDQEGFFIGTETVDRDGGVISFIAYRDDTRQPGKVTNEGRIYCPKCSGLMTPVPLESVAV